MGFKRYRAKTAPEDKGMRTMSLYLPQSMWNMLKAKSDLLNMPMNRLACYAIDLEFDKDEDAFDFPCEKPTTVFVEHAYVLEAGRILRWLEKAGPMSADQIMLSRRDIGVPDRNLVMPAIRELLEVGLAEEIYPRWLSNFKFDKDYRVIAVKNSHKRKEQEIEKLKKRIEHLQGGTYGGPIGTENPATENSDEEVSD